MSAELSPSPRRPGLWRPALLLALAVAMIFVFRTPRVAAYVSPERLRGELGSLGWIQYPAFVALYAALAAVGAPGILLAVAGALVYGLWKGYVLVVTGGIAGALAAFLVSRHFARQAIAHRLPPRARRLDEKLERHGMSTVIFFRLFPVVPYNVFNYAAGLTRMRFSDYAAGTAVGILPGTFAVIYATVSATKISLRDPSTWFTRETLSGAAVFLVVMGGFPLAFRIWQKRRIRR